MPHRHRNRARQFCSVSCGAIHSTRTRYKDSTVKMNCEQCSKEFVTNSYASKTKKYCSNACKYMSQKIAAPYIDCKQCGESFALSKQVSGGWNYNVKYCSKECVNNSQRKEGWCTDKNGYKYATFNGKSMFEHRLIMEGIMGRKLTAQETVHHINGDRMDNRPINLELWSSKHGKGQRVSDKVAFAISLLEQYPEYLEERGFSLTKLNINNVINLSEPLKRLMKTK